MMYMIHNEGKKIQVLIFRDIKVERTRINVSSICSEGVYLLAGNMYS